MLLQTDIRTADATPGSLHPVVTPSACPFCSNLRFYTFRDGKRFRCAQCKKDFTIKTGTVFGMSKLPIFKLKAVAAYINQGSVTSVKLATELGVTQKTAFYLKRHILAALPRFQSNSVCCFGVIADSRIRAAKKTARRATTARIAEERAAKKEYRSDLLMAHSWRFRSLDAKMKNRRPLELTSQEPNPLEALMLKEDRELENKYEKRSWRIEEFNRWCARKTSAFYQSV